MASGPSCKLDPLVYENSCQTLLKFSNPNGSFEKDGLSYPLGNDSANALASIKVSFAAAANFAGDPVPIEVPDDPPADSDDEEEDDFSEDEDENQRDDAINGDPFGDGDGGGDPFDDEWEDWEDEL